MPHLFTSRSKLSDLTRSTPDLHADFRWETANAVLYKVGGFLFIIGSVFFFPRFEAYQNIGAWIYFLGSLLYLVVTGHDMCWRCASSGASEATMRYQRWYGRWVRCEKTGWPASRHGIPARR